MLNRGLAHLPDVTVAQAALQAVEQSFNRQFLEQNGKHRLQKLWRRRDSLSTNELVSLGFAINQLNISAPKWLKDTIRKIRSSPLGGHGFLTEILICGQLSVNGGTLTPAPSKQPGYDALATLSNGNQHFISIKNHDLSDREREFTSTGDKIRNIWRSRLQRAGISRALHIIAKTPISSNHRNEIFEFIQKSRYLEGNFICCGDDINLKITPIHTEANLSRKYVSEHVLLIAPQPEGEQLRFRKKLQDAFENIKKNVDRIENSCNVIIMRVHPTADIAWLQTQAMQFINDHIDSACDAVILIQPSVVRSAVGSQIHYTVQIASNLKFAQSGGGIQAPYRYQFGIGSVSMEPTKLMLMGSDGPLSEIGQRMYFYQKGEYFSIFDSDGNGGFTGNVTNPGNGIIQHALFQTHEGEFTLSGIFPPTDDLYIV
ncbi:hypothetical protein BH02_1309 [Burkholderia pseudomallei]|nr:hypothetical protein BH02_1309 [Burkholderia pseudomallei]